MPRPPVRLAVVGTGAFGRQHLAALRHVSDATVRAVVGRPAEQARSVAAEFGVRDVSTEYNDVLIRDDVDAVILCTPTPQHAAQAVAGMRAGKHVQVEIPLADNWLDAQAVAETQHETGRICMVGHTRRFNRSHRWLRARLKAGEFRLQQLDVQTHFLRRSNQNALGEQRSWTDNLLWHHAAHTVDLLRHQTGEEIIAARGLQGPIHPQLGVAMDMSIQLLTAGGCVCALSLSFNNDGPFGSVFRYIGDTGTYVARYDELVTGGGEPVDLGSAGGASDGVAAQDREFVSAIVDDREPEASVDSVLPSYRVLDALDRSMRPAESIT